jgi:hypothetical protein
MYRNICTAVLVLLVALLTLDNAHYYARASYLHLVPLLAFCGLAWALLGRDRGPTLGVTLWSLAGIGAVGVSLELIFQVYKHHPFDENGIVTMLSVCQLALISLVCFRLWQVRRAPGPWRLKNHSTIWLLIASGFAFLAVDEKALIHEGLDRSFHKLFAIQATGWTSRLDDMGWLCSGSILRKSSASAAASGCCKSDSWPCSFPWPRTWPPTAPISFSGCWAPVRAT